MSTSLNGTNFAHEMMRVHREDRYLFVGPFNTKREIINSTEVEIMEIFEIAGLATIIFGVITTAGLFVSARND